MGILKVMSVLPSQAGILKTKDLFKANVKKLVFGEWKILETRDIFMLRVYTWTSLGRLLSRMEKNFWRVV